MSDAKFNVVVRWDHHGAYQRDLSFEDALKYASQFPNVDQITITDSEFVRPGSSSNLDPAEVGHAEGISALLS